MSLPSAVLPGFRPSTECLYDAPDCFYRAWHAEEERRRRGEALSYEVCSKSELHNGRREMFRQVRDLCFAMMAFFARGEVVCVAVETIISRHP